MDRNKYFCTLCHVCMHRDFGARGKALVILLGRGVMGKVKLEIVLCCEKNLLC